MIRKSLPCLIAMMALTFAACGDSGDPATPADTVNNDTPNNNTDDSCFDRDGDGFGRGAGCRGADCDDTNPSVTTDCACIDNDGDGYGEGASCRGPDCNDNDRLVNPAAVEVPGNGKDDDCVGGDLDCVDNDGDGFGTGSQCRGLDCDDTDRNVRPGAREICGNGKDDDCEGGDEACADNCTDSDGDMHGVGDGCLGLDCDDQNPNVNASAEEICNGQDDNCDGTVDECEGALQACDPNRGACAASIGGECTRDSECVGGLTCEGNTCLGTNGTACTADGDCAESFVCTNGTCAADPNRDICDELDCEAGDMICLRELATCVECVDHLDCEGNDLCAGFTCNEITDRAFTGQENALIDMAQFLADCFNGASEDGPRICGIIDATNLTASINEDMVFDFVCDDASADDFVGGERDLSAAEAVVGCGIFNDDDLTWEEPLPAGSFWEYCMWTLPPAIFFDEPNVVVEHCDLFPTDR